MDFLDELHASLDLRRMPEDIASVIVRGTTFGRVHEPPLWDVTTAGELRRVARFHAMGGGWSSMTEDFERPGDAAKQVRSTARMFADASPRLLEGITGERFTALVNDPAALYMLVDELGWKLRWTHEMDWKRDRLPKEARKRDQNFAGYPKRQYNRRIRSLRHLTRRALALETAQTMRRLILVGRSGFAIDIPRDRFRADPRAACFIAYLTARKNQRRQFSLDGRENPVDHLADRMLANMEATTGEYERRMGTAVTDWDMIAMVHPTVQVLGHLTQEQIGERLGGWSALMGTAAGLLEKHYALIVGTDKEKMIVRRGMDSSTWNTVAGAYNAARTGWINCLQASGNIPLLAVICPGKVMRVMAADLARWHQMRGGDVDPNTKVWARLPLPWEVIHGEAECTLRDVERACQQVGLDPVASGWTGARVTGAPADAKPTPELVHGVSIADPAWAALLRRAGAFSGPSKGLRGDPALAAQAREGIEQGVVTSELPVRLTRPWEN